MLGCELEPRLGQEAALRALRELVERFDQPDRPSPPLLYGGSGRGKSALIVRAAELLIQRHGVGVFYATLADLLDDEKLRMDVDPGYRGWLQRAQTAELLVLDDAGAERDTDHTHETLRRLVDNRYRDGLPILAATNVPPERWAHAFGERTASRLASLCSPVAVDGPDWRQQQRANVTSLDDRRADRAAP
jgi:DNA replication protein DnaC